MTLGEKLRQARIASGLSQSQVSGTYMTRNMLSQLENDSASPSVKTLLYLADRLGVSAGWLIDENAVDCTVVKEKAKALYMQGELLSCLRLLSELKQLDDELVLILYRCAVSGAEQAFAAGNLDEVELLMKTAESCRGLYITDHEKMKLYALRLRYNLCCGKTDDVLLQQLLMLSCTENIKHLSAVHDLLHGRQAVDAEDPDGALPYLHRAESAAVLSGADLRSLYCLLETCYRLKEDYKMAYHYAAAQLGLRE